MWLLAEALVSDWGLGAYPMGKTCHSPALQGNNCWSHSTALITESRLCIQTHGKWPGTSKVLMQGLLVAKEALVRCSRGASNRV